MRQSPHLSFFCELHGDVLTRLFEKPNIIEQLKGLNATVSLGVLDFSNERAAVVRRLNEAGIPVVAWLLLPKDQGYWFNVCNAPQATARYAEFKAWTDSLGLQWDGVGLDVEADIQELEELMFNKWRLPYTILKRGCSRKLLYDAEEAYQTLIDTISADGYRVDSYDFPFIIDEKRAGSRVFRSLTGTLNLTADRCVLMLYSSLFRPVGVGVLWNYAKETSATAVGITGGGVIIPGFKPPPPLNWEELSRDLLIARRWNSDIHIFSLEGCIEQDFLSRLKDFNWDGSVTHPRPWGTVIKALRPLMVLLLWCSANLTVFTALLAAVLLIAYKLNA